MSFLSTLVKIAKVVKVQHSAVHDDVQKVSVFGIPLFKRDSAGKARVLGIPAKRLSR